MNNEDKMNLFINILNILNNENCTITDIKEYYNEIFTNYNETINIAKCECSIVSPKNMLTNEKNVEIIKFYDNNNSTLDNPFIIDLEHDADTFVQLKYWPNKGSIFTNEQIELIKTISNFTHTYITRNKYKELLKNARITDFQTGIPNIVGLIKKGELLLKLDLLDQYTMIFGNIKNFKNVSQLYGNSIATNIIREYFNYYNSIIEHDEICSRPGGDNILLLIKTENLNKYLDLLSNVTIKFGNKDITLQTVIGYFNCNNSLTIGESIEKAKIALSISKSTNYAPHKYTEDDEKKLKKEKEIKENFINAMNNNELITYYQPKVDINSFILSGAEALVRWYKENKLIPPIEFVPIIETSNLICDLDYYMLNSVCKDIKNWKEQGIDPVRTSINFSMKHIKDLNAIKNINQILDYYKINHNLIEIELTELTDYRDYSGFIDFINDLKKNNYAIAMDDFGSGYSSLNLLKQVDYDIIKLDKGIIDEINKPSSKDFYIVKNMIKMIKDLNMKVIAEGVENMDQIETLRYLNCDEIQGYYFDKPLTKEDFTKRLVNKNYWSDIHV